jgi:2-oxoglutarate ferredoxin oxidoreductase subunit alpha
VLGPSSVQELADLTYKAFDLSDKYRVPVMILGDGILGQMMEPVEFHHEAPEVPPVRSDALRGAKGRPSRIVKTFTSNPSTLEELNWSLWRRYLQIKQAETLYDTYMLDDAKLVVVAFGIAARIAKGAIKNARKDGLKVGMIRPITLWPFPSDKIKELAKKKKQFLVVEMNMGQMVDDVRLSLEGAGEVSFYGRTGGVIPTPSEIQRVIARIYQQKGLKQK